MVFSLVGWSKRDLNTRVLCVLRELDRVMNQPPIISEKAAVGDSIKCRLEAGQGVVPVRVNDRLCEPVDSDGGQMVLGHLVARTGRAVCRQPVSFRCLALHDPMA